MVALPWLIQNELQVLEQACGSPLAVGSFNQKNWIEHQFIYPRRWSLQAGDEGQDLCCPSPFIFSLSLARNVKSFWGDFWGSWNSPATLFFRQGYILPCEESPFTLKPFGQGFSGCWVDVSLPFCLQAKKVILSAAGARRHPGRHATPAPPQKIKKNACVCMEV